jgi:hypothetical protein
MMSNVDCNHRWQDMDTVTLGERNITDPRDETKTIEAVEFRVYRRCLRCRMIISVRQQFLPPKQSKIVEYEEP